MENKPGFRNAGHAGHAGLVLGSVLSLATLTGCLVTGPRQGRMYSERPAVRGQSEEMMQDDYVYYPGYEVYYSSNRREYVYRDGNAWVRRPAPRGVTVDVLFAAPSVRVDFHDSPAVHHATVVRTYPRNWTPPGKSQVNKNDRNKDRKDDKKDQH
jgi:hypothetical protein